MIPTYDHNIIRQWATRQKATPAEIRPFVFDGQPAILTFIIGEPDGTLTNIFPISWESFLAQFDLLGLAFAHDAHSTRFDLVKIETSSAARLQH